MRSSYLIRQIKSASGCIYQNTRPTKYGNDTTVAADMTNAMLETFGEQWDWVWCRT